MANHVNDSHEERARKARPSERPLQWILQEGEQNIPATREPLVCKPKQIESWRIFKIMSEFVDGFELLKRYGLAASFFGSARCSLDDQIYKDATALAGKLAKRGFAIITGGSSGIMEAANRGAFQAGGSSVGLNIRLPQEQYENAYLTESLEFEHFFVRKVMLTFASEVYVYFPGGFGTLDEFFEILTLVQTKKIRKIPMVLFGKAYWDPFLELFKTDLLARRATISPEDLDIFHIVDSVDEAYAYIVANVTC